MDVRGKCALVTGGSAGIGREIALQLATAGATVIIVGRDHARTEATAALAPQNVIALQADLSRPDEQERLIEEVGVRWPQLAILVNNAGVQVSMATSGIGDDGKMAAFRDEIEINLSAPIALSLGLMPILARQGEAAIVNIASGLALTPKRSAPVYGATKAALRSFTRALRYRCEDAAPAIRVTDVIMAMVDTQMTHGRGRGKISAAQAARAVVKGIESGRPEIWVGRARMLHGLQRIAPWLAFQIFRNG